MENLRIDGNIPKGKNFLVEIENGYSVSMGTMLGGDREGVASNAEIKEDVYGAVVPFIEGLGYERSKSSHQEYVKNDGTERYFFIHPQEIVGSCTAEEFDKFKEFLDGKPFGHSTVGKVLEEDCCLVSEDKAKEIYMANKELLKKDMETLVGRQCVSVDNPFLPKGVNGEVEEQFIDRNLVPYPSLVAFSVNAHERNLLRDVFHELEWEMVDEDRLEVQDGKMLRLPKPRENVYGFVERVGEYDHSKAGCRIKTPEGKTLFAWESEGAIPFEVADKYLQDKIKENREALERLSVSRDADAVNAMRDSFKEGFDKIILDRKEEKTRAEEERKRKEEEKTTIFSSVLTPDTPPGNSVSYTELLKEREANYRKYEQEVKDGKFWISDRYKDNPRAVSVFNPNFPDGSKQGYDNVRVYPLKSDKVTNKYLVEVDVSRELGKEAYVMGVSECMTKFDGEQSRAFAIKVWGDMDTGIAVPSFTRDQRDALVESMRNEIKEDKFNNKYHATLAKGLQPRKQQNESGLQKPLTKEEIDNAYALANALKENGVKTRNGKDFFFSDKSPKARDTYRMLQSVAKRNGIVLDGNEKGSR